jgi:hypothetical protein
MPPISQNKLASTNWIDRGNLTLYGLYTFEKIVRIRFSFLHNIRDNDYRCEESCHKEARIIKIVFLSIHY